MDEKWIPDRLEAWIKSHTENPDALAINNIIYEEIQDLTTIPHLHEPAVLETVNKRYLKDHIYTMTGGTLIATNPYKKLPIYDDMNSDQLDHIYTIAKRALKSLSVANQSIIANGESGSGKTVTTKHLLNYLTKDNTTLMAEKILACNPLLEAFGNAKTIRNDNSSRFGKFVKLYYDNSLTLVSSEIETYLLEKVRVNQPLAAGERSFHIFNMIQDKEDMTELLTAFSSLDFTESETADALNTVKGIIILNKLNAEDIIPENSELCEAAGLLREDINVLVDKMTMKHIHIKVNNEVIHKKLDMDQIKTVKDALTQHMYELLFVNIVKKINQSLGGSKGCSRFIGILDIFGFEVLDHNSLEQMCINFTNERLQQSFNQHTFKNEQRLYTEEGIDWTNISFPDNMDCIDLFEKHPISIFSLLNEECLMPKGNDTSLFNKITKNLPVTTSNKDRVDLFFSVDHYAGEVLYCTKDSIEKNKNSHSNRDTVVAYFLKQLRILIDIIKSTKQQYVRCIKPNDKDMSNSFDRVRVVEQLRYGGVIEAVKISRCGYPVRFDHKVFKNMYNCLGDLTTLERDHSESFQMGKTKMFLKQEYYELLETKKQEIMNVVMTKFQSYCRMRLQRTQYLKLKHTAVYIQSCFRMFKAMKMLSTLKVKQAEKTVRNWLYSRYIHDKYLKTIQRIIVQQQLWREYLLRKHSVTKISSAWKCSRNRKNYLSYIRAVTVLQSRLRKIKAKIVFRNLKRERNSLNHMRKENNELKNRIAELESIASKTTSVSASTSTSEIAVQTSTHMLISQMKKQVEEKESVNKSLILKLGKVLRANEELKDMIRAMKITVRKATSIQKI